MRSVTHNFERDVHAAATAVRNSDRLRSAAFPSETTDPDGPPVEAPLEGLLLFVIGWLVVLVILAVLFHWTAHQLTMGAAWWTQWLGGRPQ